MKQREPWRGAKPSYNLLPANWNKGNLRAESGLLECPTRKTHNTAAARYPKKYSVDQYMSTRQQATNRGKLAGTFRVSPKEFLNYSPWVLRSVADPSGPAEWCLGTWLATWQDWADNTLKQQGRAVYLCSSWNGHRLSFTPLEIWNAGGRRRFKFSTV